MSTKKKASFGWYSEQMAAQCGTVIYEGLNGGEIEVTCVTSDGNHGTAWPDIRFVGEVTEYVRRGKPDPWGFLDPGFDYDDDLDDDQ